MASAMRKMAVYLGLVEDDHRFDDQYQDEFGDDYDEYGAELVQEDDRQDVHAARGSRHRQGRRPASGRPGADDRFGQDHDLASAHVQ